MGFGRFDYNYGSGVERCAEIEGHVNASDVGCHYRATPCDGAVHRPVRSGRRRQAAGSRRVHTGTQAGAGVQAADGPPSRRFTTTGMNLPHTY